MRKSSDEQVVRKIAKMPMNERCYKYSGLYIQAQGILIPVIISQVRGFFFVLPLRFFLLVIGESNSFSEGMSPSGSAL
jgi:hypothetical protein